MENRTLANVISQTQQTQGQGTEENLNTFSLNVFLTVYSINLAHRFQDVRDLNTIDINTVRQIAEFSIACATVGLEVWDQLGANQTQQVRQRLMRQSRSA